MPSDRPSTAPLVFPVCPFLPDVASRLDWRSLHELGTDRGAVFYQRCLEYGHDLWKRGLAARAILAVDRALLADLRGDEPILKTHPLPFRALAWLIASTPAEVFIGNPRVHYQHLADRLRGARREQRSARAWACWHLTRIVRYDLPGDPRHRVDEPTPDMIHRRLEQHGMAGEADEWVAACAFAATMNRCCLGRDVVQTFRSLP